MHGQHGANGQRAENRAFQPRHACPVSPPSRAAESTSRKSYTTKDGRKIDIGDCALFQAGNAPPFIGILRRVTVEKDSSVRLTVNWLYRPADVKLVRGIPFDAAPNEIFYSFHKDDTPAASLLHPCRVAFLRKGVELPSGVSSFVCRRVYDLSTKRLWWLTDRDYTDEHQEEVDLLLTRTKLEMQAAAAIQQPGARSPKASSLHSADHAQAKVKKRERSDSLHEPSSKRAKADDSESSFVKVDRSSVKPEEIAAITDKDGGLCSAAGVEKLLSLMQQDRSDGSRKPIEVASRRIMLAGVVAATDKQDCRDRLVQLGGLAVLDDWLQEAHKGKSGDGGGNPVEVDKVLDDLLLTLLRALQRLPVDLDALKTCAVGKSVNNLKNHKNVEIQKKARKLVETWKKRVDAEMKQSGEKPGTPGKQAAADTLQSITSAKDAKSSTKIAVSCAADAAAPVKSVGSATSKSGTTASSKENSPNNSGSNEIQGASVKEEKSCASQSQGPTWSSAPVTSACKEDVKASSKSSTRSSQAKADPSSGNQKENKWSRANANSAERPVGSDKSPGETEAAAATAAPHNQQRLILRFPNPGKSPARANGGESAKVSSPKVLDRSSSSGLGEGGQAKSSKHHAAASEISSEKRHRITDGKCSDKSDKLPNGKGSDKARDNHPTNAVNGGGMSLLATVAADEILRGDGSCVTVSTARSVLTEEGNAEHDHAGTSSAGPADQVPSSEHRESVAEVATLNKDLPKEESCQDEDGRLQIGSTTDPSTSRKLESTELPEDDDAQRRKSPVAEEQVRDEAVKSGAGDEEDALKVAGQVAKEVEQEMEVHAKQESAAANDVQPPEEPSSLAEAAADENQKAETLATATSLSDAAGTGEGSRPLFDLNEGFQAEESPDSSGQVFLPPSNPPVSSLTAPIPVMASTNGSFIPPASSIRPNKEDGWKGSAATSAFRPAEPRATTTQEKKGKPAFDIDLNVADGEDPNFDPDAAAPVRSFLSSFPSTSAADKKTLDLNESNDVDEGGSLRLRPPGMNSLRNFDLNDGPAFEDPVTVACGGGGGGEDLFLRSFSSSSSNKPKSNPVFANGAMNGGELLNLSSWFSGGSSYPSGGITGFPSGRTDQQQQQPAAAAAAAYSMHHPFVNGGGSTGAGPFASDLYRPGPSSSTLGYQANPQAAATLYSYPGFPFNSSFPFNSAAALVAQSPYAAAAAAQPSFSSMSSQVVNAAGRPPYFMCDNVGIVDSTSAGSWGRRSLDLNAGPDSAAAQQQQQQAAAMAAAALDSSDARQFSLDDAMRVIHHHRAAAGEATKRKEPDSGWDVYRGGFKWR